MSGTGVRYVPLERHGGEYAARRALFLQSYRFSSSVVEGEEGLRARLVRRIRAAVARAGTGLGRAWRGNLTLLGCFGPGHHHRHKYYLHDYA